MLNRRGIIIHAEDCGDYFASRLEQTHLNVLGIHPAGGAEAHISMEKCIRMLDTEEWRRFKNRMEHAGIAVEFEMHALSWILEREKFDTHREWFRTDEHGNKTPRFNCCVSNPEVLEYIKERCARLAKIFHPDTDLYYFWIDDTTSASCQCEKCRELSASDQALTLYNAIAEGVESVNSRARVSYLAYYSTLPVPVKVQKRKNVFLEFAPISRDFDVSLFDVGREKNYGQVKTLPALLDFFGTEDAKALDYWMDNSLFSNWKRPPKKFTLNAATCASDVAQYKKLGFDSVTSFGCFLGEDYRDLYGDADLCEYDRILCSE